jgi:ankyrin repeat protein
MTALMLAIINGHEEVVEYLMVRGSEERGTSRCVLRSATPI